LSEVLPVLTKKKQAVIALKPDAFRFVYLDPALQRSKGEALRDPSRIRIGELATDELLLLPRLGGRDESDSALRASDGVLSPASGVDALSSSSSSDFTTAAASAVPSSTNVDAPSLSSFHFQLETAGQYTEYKVIKTNQRGQ
jgi:hypothetical protein